MPIVNMYETESVKKLMPKFKDEQEQYTNMSLRSRTLICGASGTGKTNALINYISLTSTPKKGSFLHIFIVLKTNEPLYDDLINQLKKKNQVTVFKSVAEAPNCQEFPDNTDTNIAFIFDDCVNDTDKASIKKIKDYFIFGRKKV
jgi:thiaminase